MKITVCDRCGLKLEKGVNYHRVSLDVVAASLMMGSVSLSQDTKDLCDDCYKKALDFMTPTYAVAQLQADTVTAGTIESIIESYKVNPERIIKHIELCGYRSDGGYIINNMAWVALKGLIRDMKKNETKI